MNPSYIHIVWTTYFSWQPWSENGKFDALQKLYSGLESEAVDVVINKRLPTTWLDRPPLAGQVVFVPSEIDFLQQEMLRLTAENGDRVAGNLSVLCRRFEPTCVHLLLGSPSAPLGQIVGRLKSRLATLLHFHTNGQKGGANTWSKGYWAATFASELARTRAEQFMLS